MQTEKYVEEKTLELSSYNSDMLYLVRIIAAQSVLIGHLFSFLGLTAFAKNTFFPNVQSIAVIVFFLLSGLLTDYSLQRKTESKTGYSYKTYLQNHYSRIFGSLIPALLFVVVLDGLTIHLLPERYAYSNAFTWKVFVKNLVMLPHNYVPFGSDRPLWTLYYEWWMYIAYGYGYLLCKNNLGKGKIKVWQFVLFLMLMWIPFVKVRPALVWAFILGISINRVYKKIEIKHVGGLLAFGGIFIAWGVYSKDAYHLACPILLAILLLQVLAIGNMRTTILPRKTRKVMKFVSGCTYPLYLTHYTIIEFLLCFLPGTRGWKMFWIAFALSNVVAVAFYMIEQNVRKWWKQRKSIMIQKPF